MTTFLAYFTGEVSKRVYKFDVAIEFRNNQWFNDEVYSELARYNVAIVAAQSSRYPGIRQLTTNFTYIRMHGPEKLFASSYSSEQLEEWATYIKKVSPELKKIYVYFNNDFNGYAIKNAEELKKILII